ncbi:MAG TPA: phosphatidylglycerophosphatase A [Pyrinomonadaceae bacterium]|nr:phosphatidylglycerophosphatase A [Pyrinomonadaceae bacterium]
MPSYDELIHISAAVEAQELAKIKAEKKTPLDYFSLAITTFGVGYIPIAPGTFGSAVGVLIYLAVAWAEANAGIYLLENGWRGEQITAWLNAVNLIVFLLFCLLGVWAANRAVRIFKNKDPQKAVVDEVIGQLIVFLFVPFAISWQLVLAGFLLFRLFDIWKPYPIDSLQNLPAGIGVCADDILAGVYGGACLALIYAIVISF